jgi:hypothetical protein
MSKRPSKAMRTPERPAQIASTVIRLGTTRRNGMAGRRRRRSLLRYIPGFIYILVLFVIGQLVFSDPRATLFEIAGYRVAWVEILLVAAAIVAMAEQVKVAEPGVNNTREVLAMAPGVVVVDARGPGGYPTPVTHAAGQNSVFVGRLRDDPSRENGLLMWVVADNVRKGAALNAVQIAETLVKSHL